MADIPGRRIQMWRRRSPPYRFWPTRSSGCKLRGGPKISRKIIALRKPDLDLSNAAISAFDCSVFEAGSVAIAYASADLLLTGGAGSGDNVVLRASKTGVDASEAVCKITRF